MTQGIGIIQRAFDLAEDCTCMDDLKAKLKAKHYFSVDAHLGGRSLRADLKQRLRPRVS